METLVFAVGVGWPSIWIGVFSCIAVAGLSYFPQVKAASKVLISHLWSTIAVVIVLVTVLYLVVSHSYTPDILVGRLDSRVLLKRSEWLFYLDLLVVMIAAAAFLPVRERLRGIDVPAMTAILWRVNAGLVIILGLLLPMLFGHLLHPTRYPLIMFKSDGQWQNCAIAIYQSERGVVIWQAKDHFGRDVVTGPMKDVRAIAAMAALNSGMYPKCDDLGKL
jgi:hypothetical protein